MKSALLTLGLDTLIYGIGTAFARCLPLLTLPVFTSLLTPEDYGALSMITLLSTFIQPICSLGLGAAMGPSYFAETSSTSKREAVWSAAALSALTSSILLALAWSFPEQIASLVLLPAKYAHLVPLGLTSCAINVLSTAHAQRVQFEGHAKLYVACSVGSAVIGTLCSLALVAWEGLGAKGVVIGQIAGSATAFGTFCLATLSGGPPRTSRRLFRELLALGMPMVPSFLFLFVIMQSSRYILEVYHGLEAVGIYSVGFAIGSAMGVITAGFSNAWYPFFMSYQNRQADVPRLFSRAFTSFTIALGFLCLCFFLASSPIVSVLTQPQFQQAQNVVGWSAVAFAMQAAFSYFLPGIYYNRDLPWVSVIQGVSCIAGALMTWPLVILWGIEGAAIGLALSNTIMAGVALAWNFANRKTYPRIPYDWRRAFAVALMVAILACLNSRLRSTDAFRNALLAAAIGLMGFVGLLAILPRKERDCAIAACTRLLGGPR